MPPDVAEQQDPLLCQRIIDYRNAALAVSLFNQRNKSEAFDALQSQPVLLEVLAKMTRAQQGLTPAGADLEATGRAVAQAHIGDATANEDDGG